MKPQVSLGLLISVTDLEILAKEKLFVPELKDFQREIVSYFLEPGFKNLMVLMPTGSGKSLCFTLPGFRLPGPFLIIYPLKALAADQLRRFSAVGLEAAVLQGGQTKAHRKDLLAGLQSGRIKYILTNPETLKSEKLLVDLEKIRWESVIIDEVHCIAQWGRSFRPAYLELGPVIHRLKPRILAGFSATAGKEVLNAVTESLFPGKTPKIFQGNPDRPNINYHRWNPISKNWALYEALRHFEKPMILFCTTRDQTRTLAVLLKGLFPQEDIRIFHAGLKEEEKKSIQDWFLGSSRGILAATKAFGLGVDKSNIRSVIHLSPPKDLEDFLQESGRAGRDGQPCISLVLESDSKAPQWYGAGGCIRKSILGPLGWKDVSCKACGPCLGIRGAPLPWFLLPCLKSAHHRLSPRDLTLTLAGLKPPGKSRETECPELWNVAQLPLEIVEDIMEKARVNGLWTLESRFFFKGLVRFTPEKMVNSPVSG